MALQETLSIIKPDGVAAGHIGEVLTKFEKAGLKVVAMKMLHLTREEAAGFYAVHRERPFFESLLTYITSGPVVVSILRGENAIQRNRQIMGPTDSTQAPAGTIRGDFGTDIERNTVHGSDGPDTAATEIAYFFAKTELVSY